MKKKSEQKQTENKIQTKMFSMIFDIREILDQMVTRKEFEERLNQLYNHVDGFIKLHTVLDTEVASLRYGHDTLDKRMSRVEKSIGLEPVS